MKKIYIAGPITGVEDYKENFAAAERALLQRGDLVMNPAVLPAGFEHHEYMKICLEMLDVCDVVYLLKGWEHSDGARAEVRAAIEMDKLIAVE